MMPVVSHSRTEHVLASVAVVLAVALYLALRGPLGEPAVAISIIPVAVIATTYGTRAGLIASAVAFPFNTFLLEALIQTSDSGGGTVTSSLISVSLFGVAWLFGRFHLLRVRLAAESRLRARAEAALRLSEDRLNGFLAATPDTILRLGPTGRLLELHGAHHLMESPPPKEEFLFRSLDEVLPPEAAAEIMKEAELVRNGTERTLSISLPGAEGDRHLRLSLTRFGERDVVVIARTTDHAPRSS